MIIDPVSYPRTFLNKLRIRIPVIKIEIEGQRNNKRSDSQDQGDIAQQIFFVFINKDKQ